MMRVFHDRLISEDDRAWFCQELISTAANAFGPQGSAALLLRNSSATTPPAVPPAVPPVVQPTGGGAPGAPPDASPSHAGTSPSHPGSEGDSTHNGSPAGDHAGLGTGNDAGMIDSSTGLSPGESFESRQHGQHGTLPRDEVRLGDTEKPMGYPGDHGNGSGGHGSTVKGGTDSTAGGRALEDICTPVKALGSVRFCSFVSQVSLGTPACKTPYFSPGIIDHTRTCSGVNHSCLGGLLWKFLVLVLQMSARNVADSRHGDLWSGGVGAGQSR